MEFVEETPLRKIESISPEIHKVFHIIKKLRGNKLVFGGIKLDNFIIDDDQRYS